MQACAPPEKVSSCPQAPGMACSALGTPESQRSGLPYGQPRILRTRAALKTHFHSSASGPQSSLDRLTLKMGTVSRSPLLMRTES
jgi:hypothetical protein